MSEVQGSARILTNFIIRYSPGENSNTCSLCSQPYEPREPMEIYDVDTGDPICQNCSQKYATEMYLLLQSYYDSVSERERKMTELFQ